MRRVFAIAAIFSCWGLAAQPCAPSEGREQPRCEVIAYPTAEAATAADGGNNRYFTRITQWARQSDTLSTPFTVPFVWANRQVLFHVGSASVPYEVLVNGRRVARNADGNTPAEFNLTRYVREGRNRLDLILTQPSDAAPLESWKEAGAAPGVTDTWIMSQPTMRVRDVLTKCWPSNDGDGTAVAEVGIVVKSSALNPRTSRIYYDLLTPSGETAATGYKELTLDMRREDTLRFVTRIPSQLLWSAELPTLYTLRLKTQHEGRFGEYLELPLGFRTVATDPQGHMTINGQPVRLHAYEINPQIVSANLLARLRELGFNTLKFMPGYISPELLEMCDIQGVYVVAQAPIDSSKSGASRRKEGNPSNDPAWQAAYIERTGDSYHTTKRHPSVIAFSLASMSSNGINLYESYLNLKRYGDSRPIIYPDAAGEWNDDPLLLD